MVTGTFNNCVSEITAVSLFTESESLAVMYSLLPLSLSGSFFVGLPLLFVDLLSLSFSPMAGTSTHLSL